MFGMRRSGEYLCLFLLIFGLFDRSKSQINGASERIGCIDSAETETRTCYDAYSKQITWPDAWNECVAMGGQLALPSTVEISDHIGKYTDSITANLEEDYPVWIGGHELNSSDWQWIGGKNIQSGSVPPMTVINLTSSVRPFETCATLSSNASGFIVFQSAQCRMSASFICQSAYNSTLATNVCQIGSYNGVVSGSSCYAAVSTVPKRSWFKARYDCIENGADIAVFDESKDQLTIRTLLASLGQTAFWIGLRRYPWVWPEVYSAESGKIEEWEEMTFSLWGSSSPNYNQRSCMAMIGKGGMGQEWTNHRCNETHPYICQQTFSLGNAAPANMSEVPEGAPQDSGKTNIVPIVVPCVIVAGILIIIGLSTYCYFSKRKGYIQH